MNKSLKYLLLTASAALLAAGCAEDKTYALPEVYPSGGDTPSDVEPPHQVRARKNKTSAWGDYLAYTVDRIHGFTPARTPPPTSTAAGRASPRSRRPAFSARSRSANATTDAGG